MDSKVEKGCGMNWEIGLAYIYILLSIKWTGMDEFTTDDHTTVGRNPLEEME